MPRWLRCEVNKGMFSDELTVTVKTRSGESVAVFVPRQAADDQNKRVRVNAFQTDGDYLAVLPDVQQSVIHVDERDLLPA
jgi:hypothetical protein